MYIYSTFYIYRLQALYIMYIYILHYTVYIIYTFSNICLSYIHTQTLSKVYNIIFKLEYIHYTSFSLHQLYINFLTIWILYDTNRLEFLASLLLAPLNSTRPSNTYRKIIKKSQHFYLLSLVFCTKNKNTITLPPTPYEDQPKK